MTDYVTKDSGQRQKFSTGSQRDTRAGKGRFDLVPPGPLRRLAQLYERGAVKYGERNWEKGQPSSRYLDSLLRHANQYLAGDRDEDHLAGIVFNAFGIMFNEDGCTSGVLPAELHDLLTKESTHANRTV